MEENKNTETTEYRTITAPVLIPERPDCDYTKGEPPLTQEQIKQFKNSYDNYQIIDYDHELTDSDSPWYMRRLGRPVRSWITTEPTTYTNVAGKTESIPGGSWWLTSHVTDPEAIRLIDEGLLTAYSITVGNRSYCDKFMQQWNTSKKNDNESDTPLLISQLTASKRKTLIKDIVDPVGFTVSLTGLPCVGSAMFSRDCLEHSREDNSVVADKNKIGGEKMPEETNNETRFSIRELLGLKEFFANKSDDEKPEETSNDEEEAPKTEDEKPKNDYVTREELDQKFDDFKGEIVDIFDEKLEKVVEKLTVKKEEPEPEKQEDKGEGEGETADKHQEAPAPSSQLDNTDDGNNMNTANKTGNKKSQLMAKLNRKPNGEYKFPKNY